MRVMVLVKASPHSEAGLLPGSELFEAMGRFNEALATAGILLDGDGLRPSRDGKRVRCVPGGKRTVYEGPFAETRELVAGFWLWKVDSMAQALEWVARCPDPMPGEESEIEIRPLYEAEDFAAL
jgi:hypothetical protein